MTATSAWPTQGPRDRDELAAWTTIELSEQDLGVVPPLAGPPHVGWTELVDGRGVYLRREPGPVGATPVWFVHGLGGASTDWTRLSAALAPKATGYSIDLPGSGRSEPPPAGRYSPVADADLVAGAIRAVTGGPVHLVGNSYGGVVTTLLAANHPDLVRTLTVISPAVPDLRLTSDRGADPRLGLLLVPGTATLAYQRLAAVSPMARARGMGELCFGHPELISDEDYRVAAAEHTWRAALPWTYSSTVGTLRGLMAGYLRPGSSSFAAAASRVRVPTLVVWGTRDRLVDVRLARQACAAYSCAAYSCAANSRAANSRAANSPAELLVLAECGHVPQMEDPWSTARGILALWQQEATPEMATEPRPNAGRAAPVGSNACGNLVP